MILVAQYFALAGTHLEESPAVTGSAVMSHRQATDCIHAVEVDDEGHRAEATACGQPVRGEHHQIPRDEVQLAQRCPECSDALGTPDLRPR
jgi:hypothetical protein